MRRFLPLSLILLMLWAPKAAYADNLGLIFRGVAKTVGSVFQLPVGMLASSGQAFPFGLISGAVGGTARAVSGTLSGAVDIARGAAPYAKYMIFMV